MCEIGGSAQCEAIFRHALSLISTTKPENMQRIFDFLVELALHWEQIALTNEESKALRSLMVEGWGAGGAQEDMRDACMVATVVFLSRIHPSWTVEERSGDEEVERQVGKFSRILASIVCGEFRLLEHECVHMLDQVGEGGRGPKRLRKSASDGEISSDDLSRDSDRHTNGQMPEFSDSYLLRRLQRAVRMSFVCFEVFDSILGMLVGDSPEESVWGDLPGDSMEVLQKEMSQSIHLFYEFISYSAKFNKDNFLSSSEFLVSEAKLSLKQYLNRGMQCFSQWIIEDDNLHRSMINVVEQLFPSQTEVPVISSADAALEQLPAPFCKRVVEVILRGQKALATQGSEHATNAFFKVASMSSFDSTRENTTPANLRVVLMESSCADLLVTCLAVLTQLCQVGDDVGSLTKVAKKLRFVSVCTSRVLCSIVCAVCTQLRALGPSEPPNSELAVAVSVASMALELLFAVFQARADKVGSNGDTRYGDSVRDALAADYVGLSVREVVLLKAAAEWAVDDSAQAVVEQVVGTDDFEYWVDTSAQLLEGMRGIFSESMLQN